jgi:hypothetical protein
VCKIAAGSETRKGTTDPSQHHSPVCTNFVRQRFSADAYPHQVVDLLYRVRVEIDRWAPLGRTRYRHVDTLTTFSENLSGKGGWQIVLYCSDLCSHSPAVKLQILLCRFQVSPSAQTRFVSNKDLVFIHVLREVPSTKRDFLLSEESS